MVFSGFGLVYGLARKFTVVFVRIILMFWGESDSNCKGAFGTRKERNETSVFTVFASHGNRNDIRYAASFTIEATLVLGVIFMTIALMIQYAYTEYDKVTGTVILQEMIVRERSDHKGEDRNSYFKIIGKQLGNPRLWLGEYEIEISNNLLKIEGKATAGEWSKTIEIDLFRPSTFLRQEDCLRKVMKDGEENNDGTYRVQAGNESELYDDSFGNGEE